MEKNIWSFDIGTGSIGECVRAGDKFLHVDSLIIPDDFAETKTAASLRRQMRTRTAHKAREIWLDKCLSDCGLEILHRRKVVLQNGKWKLLCKGDERLEREFPQDGDNTCFNSIALRCKLILGEKLEQWQVYKALNSAIQNRGYDAQLPWGNSERVSKKDDENEYIEQLQRFEKQLGEILENIDEKQIEKFNYPCFLKAYKMGVWSPEKPEEVELRIDHKSERASGYTVPRNFVEKEFTKLVEMAARQYPSLKGKSLYFLYGPSERAYASFYPECREEFDLKRGAESDWQGVLGQKIPRFDNRIIDKCCLIPRLNVCKIKPLKDAQNPDDFLAHKVTFALKLLNLRFFRQATESTSSFTFEEFLQAFQAGEKTSYKFTEHALKKFLDKMNCIPMEGNLSVEAARQAGRAAFSRPAMKILLELIFSGKSPAEFYEKKKSETTNTDSKKGLTLDDLSFLKKMGECPWQKIHIPDVKTRVFENIENSQRDSQIRKLIGSQNDPIVRHRLFTFYQRIKSLSKFGVPDKVVIEFVREDFLGKTKKMELIAYQKLRQNQKLCAAKELDAEGLKGGRLLIKYELLKEQGGECIYTGEPISITDLPNCEIEHIVPRSRGGADSRFNYVVCSERTNKEKGDRTPYEWLRSSDKWQSYMERVKKYSRVFGRKKSELLLSDEATKLSEKYTSLAETAWIAKLAKTIVSLYFGFSMSGELGEQRVIVVNGSMTSAIRNSYNLTSLLVPDELVSPQSSYTEFLNATKRQEEKNRKNQKHHALDAMVMSFIPAYMIDRKKRGRFLFPKSIEANPREFFKSYLDKLIPRNIAFEKPALEDGIYAKRVIDGKDTIVRRYGLESLARTGIAQKYDLGILKKVCGLSDNGKEQNSKIINPQIRKLVAEFASTNPSESDWVNWCQNAHLKSADGVEGTKIKRVLLKVGDTTEYKDLSKDACGGWRKGDTHKGQIIWKNKSGKYCVAPIYVHSSQSELMRELRARADFAEIYQIFRSGCLVELKQDYYNEKNGESLSKGIYKLNTLKSDGRAIFTSTNGIQTKNAININYLIKLGLSRYSVD